MRDAAGEVADRVHLLALSKHVLQFAPRGFGAFALHRSLGEGRTPPG
ncbi:hypothetical protein [Sphingomonas sp. Leaf4]|nr:hypothetical protein [Sphingomonas sp. Leaf4]